MEIEELKESATAKDYLHKISGVDQGEAQQINKTTTHVLVFTELSHFFLIQYLLVRIR